MRTLRGQSRPPPVSTEPSLTARGCKRSSWRSTFWMQELDPDKALRHAMHIDVSVAREEVEARVAAAVSAGGRIVKDADAPAAWILADPAGNRVCIAAWPDGSVSPPS
jgi:4a-hydroxytetrahydrobiopterin dehydratase